MSLGVGIVWYHLLSGREAKDRFASCSLYAARLDELFSSEEDSFERCDGEIILPIASISFTQEEGLITVSIEHANGKHNDLSVFLRSYDGEKNEK